MNKRFFGVLCALVCVASMVSAQEFVWDVDFNTVINNREGGNEQTPDQTFIFTRLQPEVGVEMRHGSVAHRLMGGVAWYQPINDRGTGYKVLPTLYYRGVADNGWNIALGMIPRNILEHQLPKYMWSDSLNYCTPNLRGMVVAYGKPTDKRWMQAVVDWRQMQTYSQREAFNVVASGGLSFNDHFFALANIQYNHLAKRKNAPDDEGVNDDGTINPMLGWRTSADAPVQVNAQAGAIVQLQRCRALHDWHTPAAFVASVKGSWRWLDVEETFSQGKDLFPLYDLFGSELNLGDPYYRSKTYSRTDVRAHVYHNNFVDVSAMLTFHATDKFTGFWQQVSCRFYLSGRKCKPESRTNALQSTF